MKIKNVLFVVFSIVMYIIFSAVNLLSALNSSLGGANFVVSLIFMLFWILMIVFTYKSTGIMIYSLIVWTVFLVASASALTYAVTNAKAGAVIVPLIILFAPLSGVKGVITNPVAAFSIILVFSILCCVASLVLLIMNVKNERKNEKMQDITSIGV